MNRSQDETARALKWLDTKPDLDALRQKFPEEWKHVEMELGQAIESKDHLRLHTLMRPIDIDRIKSNMHLKPGDAVQMAKKMVRQRMAAIAIQEFLRHSIADGDLPIGWLDMLIFRRLFFTNGFRRKIVSNTAFNMLWPLVRRRHALMPLAEQHGIYCFYSREMIRRLARTIDGLCLEIGAGDGALSLSLRKAGVNVKATDNYSWLGKIAYSEDVEKQSADTALAKYQPEVVLCSWPPSANDFEQAVFLTKSVRRYIVIGSQHQFAFGNWRAYRSQTSFTIKTDADLSALLLPHDFGGAVYIFDRA